MRRSTTVILGAALIATGVTSELWAQAGAPTAYTSEETSQKRFAARMPEG